MGSLTLLNSEPTGRGVYQWQTSNDQGHGECICHIHYCSHGSYDIHYRDVILALRTLYYTTNKLIFQYLKTRRYNYYALYNHYL